MTLAELTTLSKLSGRGPFGTLFLKLVWPGTAGASGTHFLKAVTLLTGYPQGPFSTLHEPLSWSCAVGDPFLEGCVAGSNSSRFPLVRLNRGSLILTHLSSNSYASKPLTYKMSKDHENDVKIYNWIRKIGDPPKMLWQYWIRLRFLFDIHGFL